MKIWCDTKESPEGTKLVLIYSRSNKAAEIKHMNSPNWQGRGSKELFALAFGRQMPKHRPCSLCEPHTGHMHCTMIRLAPCVLSVLMRCYFSFHLKLLSQKKITLSTVTVSKPNSRGVQSSCPWHVLLRTEPAGRAVEELAGKTGRWGIAFDDYILPGFRSWNLSNRGRGWCLEDVGKLFLIGTEGLQRISLELGLNRVTVIKYRATCDSVAALPGKKCFIKAHVSQAVEQEPGHNE